jgi:hypothetical protein
VRPGPGLHPTLRDEREYLYVGEDRYFPITPGKPPPRAPPGQYTFTTRKEGGTGRLGLFAYSPYGGSSWTAEWRESDGGALTKRTEEIIATLKAAPATIQREVEESERRHQEEVRRWEAEKAERQRRELGERKKAAATAAAATRTATTGSCGASCGRSPPRSSTLWATSPCWRNPSVVETLVKEKKARPPK